MGMAPLPAQQTCGDWAAGAKSCTPGHALPTRWTGLAVCLQHWLPPSACPCRSRAHRDLKELVNLLVSFFPPFKSLSGSAAKPPFPSLLIVSAGLTAPTPASSAAAGYGQPGSTLPLASNPPPPRGHGHHGGPQLAPGSPLELGFQLVFGVLDGVEDPQPASGAPQSRHWGSPAHIGGPQMALGGFLSQHWAVPRWHWGPGWHWGPQPMLDILASVGGPLTLLEGPSQCRGPHLVLGVPDQL